MYEADLSWCKEMCYLGAMFLFETMLAVNINSRICKFIAAVSYVLNGRSSGVENVYVYVFLTKSMPILFCLDCLYVDHASMHKLSVVWNTVLRWISGISRIEHMRVHLKNCNTMSFKFLLDQRLLCFISNLKPKYSSLLYNLLLRYMSNNEIKNVMCVCMVSGMCWMCVWLKSNI